MSPIIGSFSSGSAFGKRGGPPPGVPTSVSASSSGSGSASVSFTAPSDNGFAITSYTVTSNPGNITQTGSSSPINITGLTNGTSYTFTVTAFNINGAGPTSAASNAFAPVEALVLYSSPVTIGTTRSQVGSDNSSPTTGSTFSEHLQYFGNTSQSIAQSTLNNNIYIRVPTNGYMYFTIQQGGIWRIYAQGGSGGATNKPSIRGAGVGGDYSFNTNDVIWISIGINGGNGNSGGDDLAGGAGGGATVVAKSSSTSTSFSSSSMTLLLMAAGSPGQHEGRFGTTVNSSGRSRQGAGGGGYNNWLAQNFNGSGAGYGGQTTYGGFGGGTGTDDGFGGAGGYDSLFSSDPNSYIDSSATSVVRNDEGTLTSSSAAGAVRLTRI